MSFYNKKSLKKIPKVLGFFIILLFSSATSLIISSALPTNTVNAAACTSSEIIPPKYSLELGSGNIREEKTGSYTESSSRGTNCVEYGSPGKASRTTIYTKTSDNKRYEASGVTCGPVITFTSAPTSAGKKQASLQERTTNNRGCTNSGSVRSIDVIVSGTTSSGVCKESYDLDTNQGVIYAQVCKNGVISSKVFSKNSTNPKIYDYADNSGRTCSQAAKITLTTESPTGSTVDGSYQAYKTAGNGTCTIADGGARTVVINIITLDCSILGEYSAVGCSYAQQQCAASGAEAAGIEALKRCHETQLNEFKGYVDQCTAGAADKEATINCLIENAPIVASQLQALLSSTTKSTCVIEGVGWIVCPVVNFLAGVSDGAFSVIKNFLVVDLSLFDRNSGTYSAWVAFRNIANVLFLIAFLFIIFSQLTGQGASNYGIKKTLPRLVIAVILVNLSFFICQLAVDVTQIIGASLSDFLQNIPVGSSIEPYEPNISSFMLDILAGTGLVLAIGTAVVGGAVVVGLSVSIPVLLAFLVAVIMTVVILIGRQAGIIILMVLSPLAFVAYLLPNTEQWFKKWYKMFLALLMVYPIVALLYGGGALAAKIFANTASQSDGAPKFWLSLMAIGVATIPLIMTPAILRTSMNAMGTIGTKLSGFASKMNGQVRKTANTSSRYGEAKQGIRNRFALYGANRRANGKLQRRIDNSRVGRFIGLDKGSSRALDVIEQEFEKEVKAESNALKTLSLEKAVEYATTGIGRDGKELSEEAHAALVDRIMSSGGFNQRQAVLKYMASNKDNNKTTLRLRDRAVRGAYARGDQNIYGTDFGDKLVQLTKDDGTINSSEALDRKALQNVSEGNFSAEHFVQGQGSAEYIAKVVANSKDSIAKAKLIQAGALAQSNESTKAKFTGKIKEAYQNLVISSQTPDTNQQQTTSPTTTPEPRRATRPAGPPSNDGLNGETDIPHNGN